MPDITHKAMTPGWTYETIGADEKDAFANMREAYHHGDNLRGDLIHNNLNPVYDASGRVIGYTPTHHYRRVLLNGEEGDREEIICFVAYTDDEIHLGTFATQKAARRKVARYHAKHIQTHEQEALQ